MKLKFLTLFMVLGMFALGTPVKAQEEAMPREDAVLSADEARKGQAGEPEINIGSVVKALVCTALNALESSLGKLPSCCDKICTDPSIDPKTVGKCIYSLSKVGQTAYCTKDPSNKLCTATAKAVSIIQSACMHPANPVCTGVGCSLSSTVKKACGYICCNVGAGSGVKNCIGGVDQCTSTYENETSCLNSGAEHDHTIEPF